MINMIIQVLNGLLSRNDQKEAISIPIGIIPAGSDNSLVWTVLGVRDPVSAAIAIVKVIKFILSTWMWLSVLIIFSFLMLTFDLLLYDAAKKAKSDLLWTQDPKSSISIQLMQHKEKSRVSLTIDRENPPQRSLIQWKMLNQGRRNKQLQKHATSFKLRRNIQN